MNEKNRITNLILVDEQDGEIGVAEKLAAHKEGRLHRAFSVFIFNSRGELMLQKRADGKYHSPGLWTNTCCGHPTPGEGILEAAKRRLGEEMGFACDLKPLFTTIYRAEFENGLTEHEFLHVFAGFYEGNPLPDPKEASAWRLATPEELLREVGESPETFTYWFKLILRRVLELVGE